MGTLKCWAREKNERHQQGGIHILVPNLTLASPAICSGSAKMALDASDVQTDEDFYEDLVSHSLWLVFGGKVQMSPFKWVNCAASRCSVRLMHNGRE